MFSVILSVFLLASNDLPWWIIVAVAISLGSYFYTALLHGELLGVVLVAFQVRGRARHVHVAVCTRFVDTLLPS